MAPTPDLPTRSRLVDTNRHRPAVRTEKPLPDQPRLGVCAVNRLGGCRESSGHNDMFVAFGLKRHLAHGMSFRRSVFKRVAARKAGKAPCRRRDWGVILVPRLWWAERGENLRRAEGCRQPTSGRYAIRRWSG